MFPRSRWTHRALIAGAGFLSLAATGVLMMLWIDSLPSGPIDPYLQRPAPDAMSIHWRTAGVEATRLEWRPTGTSDWRPLRSDAPDLEQLGVEHSVRLRGLSPATRYEYRVFGRGVDPEIHHFRTPPAPGASVPLRAWVLGDPGRANAVTRATRSALEDWQADHPRPGLPPVDLVLTTGDNAYPHGRDRDYRDGFFAPWADWLAEVPVWPVIGNHDARRWAYGRLFDFPSDGESGGLPSGSERYFSFDDAGVHFVVLDSETSDLSADSPMARWLQDDLAQRQADWTIALFHRPPFSHGTHDSDHPDGSDWRMTAMREVFVPLLEEAGVDLVLSGHSHVYERMRPRSPAVDGRDASVAAPLEAGREDKAPAAAPERIGTTYLVVGSSSTAQASPLDHPQTAHAEAEPGALVLDIDAQRLVGHFIRADGSVGDEFTLHKQGAQ